MRQYGMSIGDQQRPEACLVISYNDADQGRQFTCLRLYAATDGAYNQIYGIVDQLTGTYGFKNQEPSDHEVNRPAICGYRRDGEPSKRGVRV